MTPNQCYTQTGFSCMSPARHGVLHDRRRRLHRERLSLAACEGTYDNPEFVQPEVLVNWGRRLAAFERRRPVGPLHHRAAEARREAHHRRPARELAFHALPVLHAAAPRNTDTAMAIGLLRVLIDEDLYDHEFVEKWCYGFDEFAARINDPEKGMTPERAAAICEVDVDKIYAAARRYATAKPAAIAWGLAFDQNQNGNQAGHALLALMAITGNVDVPGGQIIAEIPAAAGRRGACCPRGGRRVVGGRCDRRHLIRRKRRGGCDRSSRRRLGGHRAGAYAQSDRLRQVPSVLREYPHGACRYDA
ncbi:MAG: hypothetical protein V8S24_04395 [Gordonibacter pamelaeae]